MFLIVAHHFSVHGGVPIWSADAPLSVNFYIDQLLSTGGKIGVDLFVLITGYFLAQKISKFSSLVYLWITTFFYVLVFYLIFTLSGLKEFTWGGLISCFFPIRNDFYWFVSAYFLLILLSPFLSFAIKALGPQRLLAFLLVFGLVWTVVPTITTKTEYYGSTLFMFVYLFGWGAFLRLKEKETVKSSYLIAALAGSWFLIALLTALADFSNRHISWIGYVDWFTFANLNSFFSLVCALSLFLLFKQWDLGYKPWINKAATAMLGVYLIHENPLVYPWLWKSCFNVSAHLNSPLFVLYALGVVSLIFVVCTALDLVRNECMRRGFNRLLLPALKPIDEKIASFFKLPN